MPGPLHGRVPKSIDTSKKRKNRVFGREIDFFQLQKSRSGDLARFSLAQYEVKRVK